MLLWCDVYDLSLNVCLWVFDCWLLSGLLIVWLGFALLLVFGFCLACAFAFCFGCFAERLIVYVLRYCLWLFVWIWVLMIVMVFCILLVIMGLVFVVSCWVTLRGWLVVWVVGLWFLFRFG